MSKFHRRMGVCPWLKIMGMRCSISLYSSRTNNRRTSSSNYRRPLNKITSNWNNSHRPHRHNQEAFLHLSNSFQGKWTKSKSMMWEFKRILRHSTTLNKRTGTWETISICFWPKFNHSRRKTPTFKNYTSNLISLQELCSAKIRFYYRKLLCLKLNWKSS